MRRLLFILLASAILCSCDNPFAPKLRNSDSDDLLLGDQKTVEGVFQNWRYAYILKDTLVYSNLIANNFTFIYRNYDKGVDLTWGRDEEMITTYGLFQAAQNLDLIWNETLIRFGDSLNQDITRGFNLQVVFDPDDILRIQGRAVVKLQRNSPADNWKVISWRDESNF